jgi:glutathione S-transferase
MARICLLGGNLGSWLITTTESRAICRYLAAKYDGQGTKLIPDAKDDQAAALFEQWASVELQNYDKWLEPIVDQKFFNKSVSPSPTYCIRN